MTGQEPSRSFGSHWITVIGHLWPRHNIFKVVPSTQAPVLNSEAEKVVEKPWFMVPKIHIHIYIHTVYIYIYCRGIYIYIHTLYIYIYNSVLRGVAHLVLFENQNVQILKKSTTNVDHYKGMLFSSLIDLQVSKFRRCQAVQVGSTSRTGSVFQRFMNDELRGKGMKRGPSPESSTGWQSVQPKYWSQFVF